MSGARFDERSMDLLRGTRLPREWFARDARVIARALIGCLLVHEMHPSSDALVARIVETEAYCGSRDLACHARAGLTRRTRSLLGPEGNAYVFFVYGMHDCFNVTCKREGEGHAVLVRAAEPVAGFDPGSRLDGPARLARAMRISRAQDGLDLTRPPLYFCGRAAACKLGRPASAARPTVGVSARVGVAYAGEWATRPWRFFDAKSAAVSRPPRSAIGDGASARTDKAHQTKPQPGQPLGRL
jgi:DNA-3-methyladenine glycosylase